MTISVILFGVSVGYIAYAFCAKNENMAQIDSPVLKIILPLARKLVPHLSKIKILKKISLKHSRILIESGLDNCIDEDELLAIKLILSIAGALFLPFYFPFTLVVGVLVGAMAGWFFVIFLLKKMARKRKSSVELALPSMLDWLCLSVEAGLDFASAITRISERISEGPLKVELNRMNSEMRMGISRRNALTSLTKRLPISSVKSFAMLLIQSDSLGTAMGPMLRVFSSRLREERFARAEKRGIIASQKVTIPLTFCIMPTTFVVVFGPLIARFATGGLEALLK